MEDNTDAPVANVSALTLIIGVLILAIGVGAYLALVLTGHEDSTDKLLAFLAAPVSALLVVGYTQRQHKATAERLDQQDKQLVTITKQTNGVLDQKIQDNTAKAFTESPEIADTIRENARGAIRDLLAAHLTEQGPPGPR